MRFFFRAKRLSGGPGYFLCLVLLAASLFSESTSADSRQDGPKRNGSGIPEDPYSVPAAHSEIAIDGVLDDEAWSFALELDLPYETQPSENVPAPFRTEVLLTYDTECLYAAFRCHDPDPSSIRAHLSDREDCFGDDHVNIHIDTFNDERRNFTIGTNALGVQMDAVAAVNRGWDWSWDGIWDGAGRIHEWGYAVELAIPFDQIRFQRSEEPQIWGSGPTFEMTCPMAISRKRPGRPNRESPADGA